MEKKKTISFSEFNTYCKCPLLWRNVYVFGNKILRKITYKDLVYKKDVSNINTVGMEEAIIKAEAIKDFIGELNEEFDIDGIKYTRDCKYEDSLSQEDMLISENGICLSLPKPVLYRDDSGTIVIVTTVITSSTFETALFDTLSNLQSIALEQNKNENNVRIVKRYIRTSNIKKKVAESDEEFEARKAELIKKSKTGISRATKHLGETREEFYSRYKGSICVEYQYETTVENQSEDYKKALIAKIKAFCRDLINPELACINSYYCRFCDVNSQDGCSCITCIPDMQIKNGTMIVDSERQ